MAYRVRVLLCTTLATSLAVLCPQPPARAQERTDSPLQMAQRLARELDYRQVITYANEALKRPDNSKADLIEIYRLLGIAHGTLRESDQAREAFKRLIALSPRENMPEGRSPKIRRPFQEAGGFWLDKPEGLSLTVQAPGSTESERQVSLTANLDDRLHMAATVELRYTLRDGSTRSEVKPASPTVTFTLPAEVFPKTTAAYHIETRIQAFNEYHGEVATAQHDIAMKAPAPALLPPTATAASTTTTVPMDSSQAVTKSASPPLLEKWWFWTAVGVGAVAVGVGTYFLVRPDDGIDLTVSTNTAALLRF